MDETGKVIQLQTNFVCLFVCSWRLSFPPHQSLSCGNHSFACNLPRRSGQGSQNSCTRSYWKQSLKAHMHLVTLCTSPEHGTLLSPRNKDRPCISSQTSRTCSSPALYCCVGLGAVAVLAVLQQIPQQQKWVSLPGSQQIQVFISQRTRLNSRKASAFLSQL